MKQGFLFAAAALCLLLGGCAPPDITEQINALRAEEFMETLEQHETISAVSAGCKADAGNPISPDVFCADPTCVEYNGRLYVYGTNDTQQYREGTTGSNTYEAIRSLVVFSTSDMVNWTYHGTIPVGEIAPWIIASWAPSVCARQEADGMTHFYLYFSNSGAGVGVLTANDPLGPWSDPLGAPLVSSGMRGLGGVPNPFDPGVCIDGNGTGWLTFGGGVTANGNNYLPHSVRIVQLGDDMLSFASQFKEIPAPYFFEASELNIIGDTFVYTYNSNWAERLDWDYAGSTPSRCSMCYMTTKTPLVPSSWEYRGDYLANPGDFGYPDSNNHTHLHKFQGQYYLFYHTLQLEKTLGIKGGYRSLCVIPLAVDEEAVSYADGQMNDTGAAQIHALDPFVQHEGAENADHAGVSYALSEDGLVYGVRSDAAGAWAAVRGADLGHHAAGGVSAVVQGRGTIAVRLDAPDGETAASISFDCDVPQGVYARLAENVNGVHDLYFVFSGAEISLQSWQFIAP